MVKWLPDSEHLFMASFDDGSMMILDKEREDQSFSLPDILKEHFQITKPTNKNSRHNPVAHWRVSDKGITAFAFSPNRQFICIVGKDGLMRTIDYTNERLCDVFVSYYGRFLCVAWSPDGNYILTGGQDDLVTIWSFKETRIIARCQGHRSWVTGVAFDPLHCDDKAYRFASVGEDCKLILWDFSVNALHQPKQSMNRLSVLRNYSEMSFFKKGDALKKNKRKRSSLLFRNSTSELLLHQQQQQLPTIHPALKKCQVPFLQPIVKQTIHPDPCVDIVYRMDSIVTTDRRGRIRVWSRPQPSK
ncbi:WD40-repeat-containing domain protein [Pilaira anomala]|nr:WD40-repeat-containing domain protein [Pilaira anomala]